MLWIKTYEIGFCIIGKCPVLTYNTYILRHIVTLKWWLNSHCFCLHHPIMMPSNSYCKSCNSYRTAAIFIVYPSAVFRVLINGEGVLCDYPKNSCGRHYKFHSVLTFPTHMKTAQMLDLICSYISPTSIFIISLIPVVSSF